MGISVGVGRKPGSIVGRNLQIWTSSTSSALPRDVQSSLRSQCGALAPCGDPESMAGAEWVARPQVRFPHSPLRGARGAILLRPTWPGGGPSLGPGGVRPARGRGGGGGGGGGGFPLQCSKLRIPPVTAAAQVAAVVQVRSLEELVLGTKAHGAQV